MKATANEFIKRSYNDMSASFASLAHFTTSPRVSMRMSMSPMVLAQKRTAKHISHFIQIMVNFEDQKSFVLTIDRNMTFGYIAEQIEAEYFFRYSNDETSESNIFQLAQIYGPGHLALPFGAIAGDHVDFEDNIYVVGAPSVETTSITATTGIAYDVNQRSVFDLSKINDLDHSPAKQLDDLSTVSERFDSVLHNLISLQFFNEFCLTEYSVENVLFWIEAEIYKSIVDPVNARKFATHLYLVYLKDDAPLNINMNKELIQGINWPFTETPPEDFFLEAQHYVYNTIKGHAYIRYEESKLFARFLEFKKSDPYGYVQAHVTWDSTKMDDKFGMLFSVTHVLETPTSETAKILLDSGKYKTVESLVFRQKVLSDIVARYFPIVSPIVRSYFNKNERDEYALKQSQVGKEKKLTKFFGHRPTTEHMVKQACQDNAKIESNSLSKSSSKDIPGEGSIDLAEDGGIKRKKAEKLNEFFGKSLDKKAMKTQKLVPLSTEMIAKSNPSSTGNPRFDKSVADFRITTNDLTGLEKKELSKRARKIQLVLGKPLNEDAINNLKHALYTSGNLEIDSADQDSKASVIEIKRFAFTAAHRVDSETLSTSPSVEEDPKMIQRARIEKLSNLLGHRIGEADIAQAQAKNASATPRVLTSDEKFQYKKKASKLENILGHTISPKNIVNYEKSPVAIANSDSIFNFFTNDDDAPTDDTFDEHFDDLSNQRDKIAKLRKLRKILGADLRVSTALKQQAESILELDDNDDFPIEKFLEGDEDEVDDEEALRRAKTRLRKLRKILGVDIRVGTVLNQKFLEALGKSVNQETDEEFKKDMGESIEFLKDIIQIRSRKPSAVCHAPIYEYSVQGTERLSTGDLEPRFSKIEVKSDILARESLIERGLKSESAS